MRVNGLDAAVGQVATVVRAAREQRPMTLAPMLAVALVEIAATLAAAGLAPNHRLGQNFMIDAQAVARLVDEADPAFAERVVEIGPGTGVLTRRPPNAERRRPQSELTAGWRACWSASWSWPVWSCTMVMRWPGKSRLHPAIETAATGRWVPAANFAPGDVSIPVILNRLALPTPPVRIVATVQLEAAERLCAAAGTKALGASAATAQAAGSGRIATARAAEFSIQSR